MVFLSQLVYPPSQDHTTHQPPSPTSIMTALGESLGLLPPSSPSIPPPPPPSNASSSSLAHSCQIRTQITFQDLEHITCVIWFQEQISQDDPPAFEATLSSPELIELYHSQEELEYHFYQHLQKNIHDFLQLTCCKDVVLLIPELLRTTWFSLTLLHQPSLPPSPSATSPQSTPPPTPDRVREMEHIN